MILNKDDCAIGTGMLQFPIVRDDGTSNQEASAESWFEDLLQVRDAGFNIVELTDVWLKVGNLSNNQLDLLLDISKQLDIQYCAIALIRASIIDPILGRENLEYSHRSIDAAAYLGIKTVSFGLHESLTEEQKKELWFWLSDGAKNDLNDSESWNLAVSRYKELAKHAERVGINITLEMYEDTYLGSADSAIKLLKDIGYKNVGLNPDTGNFIRLHRDNVNNWKSELKKTLPYANYWHVKNYFRDEDPKTGAYFTTPSPLALGLIDYRWAINFAIKSGFCGEIICEHYGGDGLTIASFNKEYILDLLPPKGGRQKYISL